ncbi:MAG: glutamine synthetase family protein, partial [Mycobacterium sp.]
VSGGPASPYGGNVEVKMVDPSANPYFASAAILGLALDGIRQKAALPPETTVDPAALSDADRDRDGIVRLPEAQPEVIAALDTSARLRAILGDPAVDVVVAVRRVEHQQYADLDSGELAEKFRMAWSV